jgi:hypothetical protein
MYSPNAAALTQLAATSPTPDQYNAPDLSDTGGWPVCGLGEMVAAGLFC